MQPQDLNQQPNFQQASTSAVQQQQQPQQVPQIDPTLGKSVIDNLKQQSQQIEDTQAKLEATQSQQASQMSQSLGQKQSVISRALSQLNDKSNQAKVGGALNTNNYSNMCLAFVDDKTGNSDRSLTAYADFQKNAASGNIKTSGVPPKGSRIYFAPTPDNPAGHIMLSNGDGTGTGATSNQGIKTFSIKDWESYANQQYIGYAPPGSK